MMLSLLRMREQVLHGLCDIPYLNFQYQIEIFAVMFVTAIRIKFTKIVER